jgi:hypothetical protein
MNRGVWCLMFAVACALAQKTTPVPPPAEPATSRPTEAKSEARDPGRPVLRRGGPATERKAEEATAARPQDNPAHKVVEVDEEGRAETVIPGKPFTPEEELLERAREFAAAYIESLPNFLVEQHVFRYKGEGLRPQWKKQDELTVDVTYTDGKEDYGNIRRNGRLLRKGNPEESGTWSTGEFGSFLIMLLNANPSPKFKPIEKVEDLNGVRAQAYDFSSLYEPGHWEIRIGGTARPPFQGRIWVDTESARVMRIEMDSRQLPPTYAVDKVELTIDYDWVTIANQRHFMPVRSDNLSCYRETVTCTRNETFFRNYRKFAVESQVLQVESEITFEGEHPKKSKTTPPSLDPKKP